MITRFHLRHRFGLVSASFYRGCPEEGNCRLHGVPEAASGAELDLLSYAEIVLRIAPLVAFILIIRTAHSKTSVIDVPSQRRNALSGFL